MYVYIYIYITHVKRYTYVHSTIAPCISPPELQGLYDHLHCNSVVASCDGCNLWAWKLSGQVLQCPRLSLSRPEEKATSLLNLKRQDALKATRRQKKQPLSLGVYGLCNPSGFRTLTKLGPFSNLGGRRDRFELCH